MKKDKTNKIRNVSKEQWLSQALDTLEVSGVEAIKIERLAKALGTSRSGFYWHFNNRQDLLEHLLDYWYVSTRVSLPKIPTSQSLNLKCDSSP